jgi:hypothetical protein
VAYDGFLNSLGGVFHQEVVEIVALLIRAEPLAEMTSRRDLISKGIDVKIFPPGLWEKRYDLNAEQLAQELPLNLGSQQPAADKSAYAWGKELFEELGYRDVSRTASSKASDMVTGVVKTAKLRPHH